MSLATRNLTFSTWLQAVIDARLASPPYPAEANYSTPTTDFKYMATVSCFKLLLTEASALPATKPGHASPTKPLLALCPDGPSISDQAGAKTNLNKDT